MTPLTHLTRNNSQVGLNACQANGETVVNACMYINDTCTVYDMEIIDRPSLVLPIPSKNILRCISRARNSPSGAYMVVQHVHR